MAVFDNIKDFIYESSKYFHLDNMSAGVRAQFAEYDKNQDFAGDMKNWHDIFENIKNGDVPTLDSDEKYQELFNLFQQVFENIARDSKSRGFQENKKIRDFFQSWYGKGKIFNESKISDVVLDRLHHFAVTVLEPEKGFLRDKFSSLGVNYDTLVKNLKDKKSDELKTKEMRDALESVIGYVQTYSNPQYAEYNVWPKGLPQYDFTKDMGVGAPAIDLDPNNWFTHKYNVAFKHRVPDLIKTLVTNPKIFEYFQSQDTKGTISENIKAGLDKTSYDDEKTDNFVPEKDSDEKNVFQRVGDKLDKFKENQIDPWTQILRGTRRFFSPQAKQVIEALSKVKNKDGKKLKPTDGLKGILACKDDIGKKLAKNPTAREQWKWIYGKLEQYSGAVPNAFEGALRNPKQMRKIVTKFIMDAVKENKIDAAKTALEMLSTMKYGIAHSRTVDALGKEDLTVLSDKGLSWNKYEGVRFVTGALDKTAKYTLLGAGRLLAAMRNKWMRDNTKFRGKDGFMKSAHDLWKENNNKDTYDTDVRDKIDADLQQAMNDRQQAWDDLRTMGGSNSLPTARQNIATNISQKKIEIQQKKDALKDKKNVLDSRNAIFKNNPNVLTDLQNNINSNNANINTLGAQITNKDRDITNNSNDIARNASDINNNNAKISGNQDAISQNVKVIAKNNALISVKKAQILKFQNQLDNLPNNDPKRKIIQEKITKLTTEEAKLNIETEKLKEKNTYLADDVKKFGKNNTLLQEQKRQLEELKQQLAEQKTQLEANKTQLEDDNAEKNQQLIDLSPASMNALQNDINNLQSEIDAGNDYVKQNQDVLDNADRLNNDVKNLVYQSREAHDKSDLWQDKHEDKYMELMAYWDMLESFWKSHQFTLAANRMRNKFLEKDSNDKSKADLMTAEFLAKYKQKYA